MPRARLGTPHGDHSPKSSEARRGPGETAMKRLVITRHTMRCPLDEATATLAVRTNPTGAPSRRYRDVVSCSLRPPTPYMPLPMIGYVPELPPPLSYFREG